MRTPKKFEVYITKDSADEGYVAALSSVEQLEAGSSFYGWGYSPYAALDAFVTKLEDGDFLGFYDKEI